MWKIGYVPCKPILTRVGLINIMKLWASFLEKNRCGKWLITYLVNQY